MTSDANFVHHTTVTKRMDIFRRTKYLNNSSNVWRYEILTTIFVDIKSPPWMLDFLFIFSENKTEPFLNLSRLCYWSFLKALIFIRKEVVKPWLCLFKWYYSFNIKSMSPDWTAYQNIKLTLLILLEDTFLINDNSVFFILHLDTRIFTGR